MKKFAYKVIVAAAVAVVAGAASADVTLVIGSSTAASTDKFAQELNYSSGTGGTAISQLKKITTTLGFGVSGSQDRYIRIDLVGAKLAVASGVSNVPTASAAPLFSNSILVAGGALGNTYAIYQITANALGHDSTQTLTIDLPNLHITNGNTTSPTVQYRLYESAVAAVNAGDALASASGSILTFAKGLKFDVTSASEQAKVANSYKSFDTGGLDVVATLGTFSYGVVSGVNKAAAGTLQLSDLVSAGKVIVTGDFSAVAGSGDPFVASGLGLDTGVACSATGVTVNAAKNSAEINVGTTATNGTLCYTVNGTSAITEQTDAKGNAIKAALDITGVTGTTTADVAAATIGEITRDGTELQSPWFSTTPGYISRFFFTSTHSADARYSARVITESGNTCTSGTGATGTIPAGKQLAVDASAICSAFSGATRAAVVFTIEAPNSTIQGVYNLVNATTGSAAVAPMLRAGTN